MIRRTLKPEVYREFFFSNLEIFFMQIRIFFFFEKCETKKLRKILPMIQAYFFVPKVNLTVYDY